MAQALYDKDFYAWSNQQAALFKAKKFDQLDWENLSEEIEDMGKSERRELENRIIQLVMHLLKWKYQPTRQGTSWKLSIKLQRISVKDCLEENPSLKSLLTEILNKRYLKIKLLAAKETKLAEDFFPNECEWTAEKILDDEFFPK